MNLSDYVTVASQMIMVGAVFECICILIGYVIAVTFKLFEGGN